MEKFKTVEEIFALENLDANAISIIGVPERHREALIALAKLFVIIDHENPEFQPDFSDSCQDKYSSIIDIAPFSYYGYGRWDSRSSVGSRLCFESREKAKAIFENHSDLYKAFMVYKREIK